MGKSRGFTFIELMVTVAILAIVATMALPSMSNLIEKRRYDRNARELLNTLSFAKSQAILTRTNVNANLASTNAANTATTFNWSAEANVTLTMSSVSSKILIFNANGLIPAITADETLTLCNSKLSLKKTIIVTRLGAVILKQEGSC